MKILIYYENIQFLNFNIKFLELKIKNRFFIFVKHNMQK